MRKGFQRDPDNRECIPLTRASTVLDKHILLKERFDNVKKEILYGYSPLWLFVFKSSKAPFKERFISAIGIFIIFSIISVILYFLWNMSIEWTGIFWLLNPVFLVCMIAFGIGAIFLPILLLLGFELE